jgi:hypothetical protein
MLQQRVTDVHVYYRVGLQNTELLNVMHNKVKAIPLQAWTGPEGSRRLRLPDFKTIGT